MDRRAKDFTIPLVLIGAGLALYLIAGLALEQVEGFMIAVAIATVVQVVIGVLALYITAAIMHIEFGPLGSALLKLAAIFIFPDAVARLIPVEILDWLVAVILYLSLLAWLFDLEPLELIVCAAVIFVVRLIVGFVIVASLVASTV